MNIGFFELAKRTLKNAFEIMSGCERNRFLATNHADKLSQLPSKIEVANWMKFSKSSRSLQQHVFNTDQ